MIQALGPRVIHAELQSLGKPSGDIRLQRVVIRITLRNQVNSGSKILIRPVRYWEVPRTLGNRRPGAGGSTRATRKTTSGAGANLGRDGVGINRDKLLITLKSHISQAECRRVVQLLLYREVPGDHHWSAIVRFRRLWSKRGARGRYARSARGRLRGSAHGNHVEERLGAKRRRAAHGRCLIHQV